MQTQTQDRIKKEEKMNTYRKTAIIVGVLFLTGMVITALTMVFYSPIISDPNFLINVSAKSTQLIIGILLAIIMGATAPGIAVMMFPIFKQLNKHLALAFLGARFVEFAFVIVGELSILLLVSLSQEYVKAGAPDASYFQTLGALSMAANSGAYQMVLIIYSLTALVFFYLLYQSKLIPRLLSVWGLIGATVSLAGPLLELFGYGAPIFLFIPGGLLELFLGVWLIVKGFNSSAIASLSAKTDINEIK